MNIRTVLLTLLICFAAAICSTAIPANLFDLEVWINGAISGLVAGVVWLFIHPKIKMRFEGKQV